jgi:glycosyltransferase involved in cell wall biosynthesis
MPISNPLVSFIIPYFNAGETIQETIDSIFNQTYQKFDVWIVNDGSTDPLSIEKLQDFEENERIHILHQENAGPGAARNFAISHSKAQFYIFLDSDDIIFEHSLEFLFSQMQESDDLLYGNCSYFGSKVGVKKQSQSNIKDILFANPIALCALFRASSFSKINFDERLDRLGLEDWELFINMFSQNLNLRYIDSQPLFGIRVSEESRTFQVANQNREEVFFYISKKHHKIIYENYRDIHFALKQEKILIDRIIGGYILKPYRLFKKLIKK